MAIQQQHCHHVCPISLGGANWIENTVMLTQKQHEEIHQTLDVSSKIIRSFRLKTNHLMLCPNQYFVVELIKLQNLYFARIPALDEGLIKIHAIAMKCVVNRACTEWGYTIKDSKFSTWLQEFNYWKGSYHSLLLKKVENE